MSTETEPQPTKERPDSILNRMPGRLALAVVVAVVLIGWLLNTPPGLEGKADAIGYALCHQIPARSFQINDQPISLCARCTGMYVSLMIGLIYQTVLGRRRYAWPRNLHLAVLAVFFLAFAVDGTNSALTLFTGKGPLYPPTNISRLLTGTGMGLAMAAMILPAFHQTAWEKYDPRGYFLTWGQFLGFLAAGFTGAALILTENPFILQAFTYLGVLGIILILTLLYSMILMVIFDRENSITRPTELIGWLLAGLLVALVHIGGADAARLFLTGTWDGFHL
jgi:uncharacterized membrane protein